MKNAPQIFERLIAGRKLIIEVGKLAQQTNGSCTVQYGDTKVLAGVVISKTPREGLDYFPLMVDFEERLYAAGKIKGSRFIKREGRPTDEAILSARLIDRSIRPLFDNSIRNDVQVVITALSVDGENGSDFPAMIAASCALGISDIPWNGPIGAISLGMRNNEIIVNPTHKEKESSELFIFLSGLRDKILMIESLAQEVPEPQFQKTLQKGMELIPEILDLLEEVRAKVGKAKIVPDVKQISSEEKTLREKLQQITHHFSQMKLHELWGIREKTVREEKITQFYDMFDEELKKNNFDEPSRKQGQTMLLSCMEKEARRLVLEEKKRVDGRGLSEIREISCDTGLLPRTHGSALFNRGETQVLSVVTLGAPGDEQTLDSMEESGTKRYLHHYNFPGFSVGEVRPLRGPGRREIGHGALAEKALLPVLPKKEDFPYTIRVVSEVFSSNGSSSQASVCGSSLSLMDAGVPITAPVAGIAIGLIMDENSERYEVLSDIQGIEDHSGDMDFKVAGTPKGVTAIQLDVKARGISLNICQDALTRAKEARMQIFEKMNAAISSPRKELSPYAPRIFAIQIDPEKISEVIGRGGETINKIIDECGGRDICKIDIEDTGLIMITATDVVMGEKALTWIRNLTKEIQIGEIYDGVITRIIKDRNTGQEIGAIVELIPGHDGMVHISEFSDEHIRAVSDVAKINQKLTVKVIDVDKEKNRISLSHKILSKGNKNPDNGQKTSSMSPRR